MPAPSLKIHVWVPGLADTGGIQHYSHCFIEALEALYPHAALTVLSKNDCHGATGTLAFGRQPGRLRTAAFAAAGIALAARDKPALTISTHPHFCRAQAVARRLSGTPYLTCAHGIEVWGKLRGPFLKALKGAAGVLAVSEFTRQALIREGLDVARVAVVPDTFRETVFTPGPKPAALLARHGLRADQPVLLTVGRLAADEAYKGHDRVMAALPEIRRTLPDARYVIVGSGDDKPRLERAAAEHGQAEAVIFAGFVPEEELPDYYRLCDAFIMPSTGEGFGIVFLEALASGRPCIVGNADASPEAIDGGRLGFAVDPWSAPAIAGAAVQLLTGAHDRPWLRDPARLHGEVVMLFGREAFQRSLGRALAPFLPG